MLPVVTLAREIVVSDVLPHLNCDVSHSIGHFDAVTNHCIEAVKELPIDTCFKQSIILAGLLHDVDDVKVTEGKTPHLHWAKYVLARLPDVNSYSVLKMIDLVSCSKNGDSYDPSLPMYYYIPRYADRLEAVGEVGLERCISYNTSINRPLHCETTLRVYSDADVTRVATKERYELYTQGQVGIYPVSLMDHMYDKLLHICVPDWMTNVYLVTEMKKRQSYLREWVVEYWKDK